MLREDSRADSSGLSHLHVRRILQSSLQRCGRPSASARVQAAADSVALESLSDLLLSVTGDHAETFRGSSEAEGMGQGFCIEDLGGTSVSGRRLCDFLQTR